MTAPTTTTSVRPEIAARSHRLISGCLQWEGGCYDDGDGQIHIGSIGYRVHRLAWMDATGEVLGWDEPLFRVCQNHKCAEVSHMWRGTLRDRQAWQRYLDSQDGDLDATA